MLPKPLPGHHDGDGTLGDEVIAEAPEEDALEGAAAAGAEDDERGLEEVDLRDSD